MQVKVNDPLVISAFLEDGITGKFVRATVKDDAGAEITGSPLTLTDLGDGFYLDQSLTKKRGTFFAILEIFDDALFAEPNQDFESEVKEFTDPPFTVLFEPTIELGIVENEVVDLDISQPDIFELEIDCE